MARICGGHSTSGKMCTGNRGLRRKCGGGAGGGPLLRPGGFLSQNGSFFKTLGGGEAFREHRGRHGKLTAGVAGWLYASGAIWRRRGTIPNAQPGIILPQKNTLTDCSMKRKKTNCCMGGHTNKQTVGQVKAFAGKNYNSEMFCRKMLRNVLEYHPTVMAAWS